MLQGDAIAKDFLIPQYESYNKPSHTGDQFEHIQPYDDGLKAETGLQDVHGQTADYYRKVANLKSFMHDVHTNYGIDVRVPDAAKGEMAIKLNELYNHALADIMNQGNKLKTSHERNNLLVSQRAQFFNDPRLKPAVEQKQGEDYTFNDVHPLVKEANDYMEKAHYMGDYPRAKALYEEKVKYFEDQKKLHPQLANEYDRQIHALNLPREGFQRPLQQSAQERIYGKKVEAAGNLVDDVVQLANGARTGYEPDTTKLNDKGNPMLINNEYSGEQVGTTQDGKPIVISRWEMNPDTGNVDLVLSNGKKLNGKSDSGTIIRMLINAKGASRGIDVTHLEEYLDKYNLQTANSEVNQQAVLNRRSKNWGLLRQKNIDTALEVGKTVTQQAVKQLNDDLGKLQDPGWFTDGEDKQVGPYLIHKASKGFSIKNLDQIHPIANFKSAKEAQAFYQSFSKFSNQKELIKFLQKQNAHVDYFKSSGSEVAPTTSTESFKATDGQFYTRTELKSTGWTDSQIDKLEKQ